MVHNSNFQPYQYSKWTVPHGFFPGKSGDRDLNVQHSSDEAHIKNRQDIVRSITMDPERMVFPYQVHGAEVHIIEKKIPSSAPQCDGLVTAVPGVTIGVSTADCAPVLFWDGHLSVGVCHAGWKGALYGVLEQTLSTLQSISKHPKTIQACIGPMIRPKNYEVSSDFYNFFVKEDPNSAAFFGEEEFLYFDLPRYIQFRLIQAKCEVIDSMQNTFGSRFFSRRWCSKHNKHNPVHPRGFGSIIGIPKLVSN